MKAKPIQLSTRHGLVYGMEYGNPGDPPVLALHGWQDNCATFSRLAPMLRGMHIVAIDLPGHGKSPWKSKEDYIFPSWVLDGFEAADALKWDKFSILGHSMGAGIASLMAGTMPERISKLALVEGLGPLSTKAEEAPELVRKRLKQLTSARTTIRPAESMEEAVARRVTPAKVLPDESARILLDHGLEHDGEVFKFRHDPALKIISVFRYTEEQVLAFLRAITAKTLVIRALQGWSFDPERMQTRLSAVSEVETIEVEGGHHVHLDHPLRVLGPIQTFLSP